VRTKRETKSAVFLEVNDGSRMGNMQCVFDEAAAIAAAGDQLARAGTGASVSVEGTL
jgi:asparaginyl-tRNA synthetase